MRVKWCRGDIQVFIDGESSIAVVADAVVYFFDAISKTGAAKRRGLLETSSENNLCFIVRDMEAC